jgi:two-component system, OmpR family, response regulator PhoP
MRILIVEDDGALREELRKQFVDSGFSVDVASDGREALLAGLSYSLDGALVGLGMPTMSDLEVIRTWRRKERDFPVIILAPRRGLQHRVAGLSAGADDYIEKPFSMEEVIVRMRGVVRRSLRWSSPEIVCGPFTLDTHRRTASAHGTPLDLTTFEFRLLETLMLNAGKVLSADALTEKLYDHAAEHESNTVAYFICRLRRKLDPLDALDPIETVYGGGYRFAIERGRSSCKS